MTVLLNRSYGAYASGQIVSLPASTEAALIAQNLAQASTALPTAGPINSNEYQGDAVIPIGAASVVVTNPHVTLGSNISAVVAQAAGDTTLTSVLRVVPANGSFTIYGPANATAATRVHWAILSSGLTPNQ